MNDQLASIHAEQLDGQLLLRLRGEIDLSNAEFVQQQIEWAIDPGTLVAIDLSEIEYLDSQGLRLIKKLVDKAQRDDITLTVVAPSGSFSRQILDLARMEEYVPIYESLAG